MPDFRLCFKSAGGLFTGYLRAPMELSAAPSRGDPSLSDTGFTTWQPYSFDNAGIALIWDQYYNPVINLIDPNAIQLTEIVALLDSKLARSAASAYPIVDIQLVDQYNNPVPSPSMCLMGYHDSNNTVRFFPAVKTISGGTTTYTSAGAERAIAPSSTWQGINVYLVGGIFSIGSTGLSYGIGLVAEYWNQSDIPSQCEGNIYLTTAAGWQYITTGYMPEESEVDPSIGPESEPGGYGPGPGGPIGGIGGPGPTFDFTSVDIPIPTKPPGISTLGFINIYKCSAWALTALGATLFPDVSQATDVMSAITALSDALWNSKLIDYVIDIHMIPGNVPAGNDEDIKIGTRTLTGIQAAKISDDYVDIDLGDLKIDEVYTNFMDYNANTARCKIFLPFYGFVPLKNEYWQSASLNITYRFNVVDGSFIAFIKSKVNRHQPKMESVIGQYSGCACVHCPASGVSYSSMFGGMVSNAAGMSASMASGNVGGVATSAINLAAASGGDMVNSNPYNASASFMGIRQPFLLIERAISHYPSRYAKEKGYPLVVTKRINSCRGFTIADSIILDGIPCTQAEKEKIRQLFKSGVIIR